MRTQQKWRSFNRATSFIFFSRFSASLSSTFISGSVHDILVLVACLLLQSLLSIYSCFRLYAFLIRSCFYIEIETPLDHALAVEVYIIVVHPFKKARRKKPNRERSELDKRHRPNAFTRIFTEKKTRER
jgi:hypothetical protein